MLPPASRPRDLDIIEYAPPAPILILVVMEDIDKAVQNEMLLAIRMIAMAPSIPALPTTQPSLKYIIIPRMVRTFGVKTPPKTPNFFWSFRRDIKLAFARPGKLMSLNLNAMN